MINIVTQVRSLGFVVAERRRQEALKAAGKFKHTCADEGMSDFEFVSVLTEELGEIARAINDGDPENLREEIIQLAACCVARLERA
jgi:NTP pyrophosphatase (non-canonical NTP hydrolase)